MKDFLQREPTYTFIFSILLISNLITFNYSFLSNLSEQLHNYVTSFQTYNVFHTKRALVCKSPSQFDDRLGRFIIIQNRTKLSSSNWKYFDSAYIKVKAGDGGNGCISFKTGKPLRFPDGGDGGNGGSVSFISKDTVDNLVFYKNKKHFSAANGLNGRSKRQRGESGQNLELLVPLGTVLRDSHDNVIAEFNTSGQNYYFLKGGKGGRGNHNLVNSRSFLSSINHIGEKLQFVSLKLELKLLADIGLIGKPNAGKSTLLKKLTRSKSKIGDYPFTTISPKLGVYQSSQLLRNSHNDCITFLDIPGLIENAHKGAGLGIEFLRHLEKCKLLLHLIDGNSLDPFNDYNKVLLEIYQYNRNLIDLPSVIVINKIDLQHFPRFFISIKKSFQSVIQKTPIYFISALKGLGIDDLVIELDRFLNLNASFENSYKHVDKNFFLTPLV